jgi:exodeoxyribonuclease X
MVAHNAPFDVAMLEKEGLYAPNVIDTLRVARALDTEAKIPTYRLQYLRYLLDLDADIDQPIQAHDAKGDVLVLEKLFGRLHAKITNTEVDDVIAEMIRISNEPSLIRRFSFGKYKGELIEDIAARDRGYLEWLYRQKKESEADETDWLFTLEKFLS